MPDPRIATQRRRRVIRRRRSWMVQLGPLLLSGGLGLLAATIVAGGAAWWQGSRQGIQDTRAQNPATAHVAKRAHNAPKGRRYPYSVVPGGISSSEELRNAVSDPIVASHYSDLRLERAMEYRLAAAQAYYVSFRMGRNIYWSRKPIRLERSEAVWSDGAHLVRARCGNRLSEIPRQPVTPFEPEPRTLDTPLPDPVILPDPPALAWNEPLPPVTQPVLRLDPPLIKVVVTKQLVTLPPLLAPPTPGTLVTGIPIKTSKVRPEPLPPMPPDSFDVPEPNTLWLLGGGMLLLGIGARRRPRPGATPTTRGFILNRLEVLRYNREQRRLPAPLHLIEHGGYSGHEQRGIT